MFTEMRSAEALLPGRICSIPRANPARAVSVRGKVSNKVEIQGLKQAKLSNKGEIEGLKQAKLSNKGEIEGLKQVKLSNKGEIEGLKQVKLSNKDSDQTVSQAGMEFLKPAWKEQNLGIASKRKKIELFEIIYVY
ncbi:MAG: hypothetical protein KGS72_08905 [Cyanobacteria bacterium REEB67]|nr:hypothetical protein [Cyanobacteria bacterium REEB67]